MSPTRRLRSLSVVAVVLAAATVVVGIPAAVAGHEPPAPNPTPTRSSQINNLTLVENQIKYYYGDPTGTGVATASSPYAKEVKGVEQRITALLAAKAHGHQHGKKAIVLDVDDTSLLTYDYEISVQFAYTPASNAVYVDGQKFPAVFGMNTVATWATHHGYSLFFVTGRPSTQQDATVGNLAKVGFPTATKVYTKDQTRPYLSSCAPTCTTIQYKSLTRKLIESHGYDIVANVGDQFSDLEGGYADHGFKVPNPMYYLP
jgi:hypothetical protein